ncbi:MAG TPA: protein-disulfide reductase DsbD, partial [Burkholderiaceae bacterium]|nr:protein-disulfide reductase DsbD [Burkholderiaceae bacterium]
MRFAAFLVAFFLLMLTGPVWAADDFLPPEKAFRISVRAPAPQTIEVVFAIAPGYYMYREQFRFSAEGVTLGDPELPPGKVKFDETFRKEVETYRDELRIALPVVRAPASFNLTVIGQGCADQGLCYPPMPSVLHVSLTAFGGDGSAGVVATGDAAGIVGAAGLLPPSKSSTERAPRAGEPISSDGENSLDRALQSGRFWTVILVFFGAGLLLSLTPCVLPMLPILSSIIAGEGGIASARTGGVMLAASYSLGMALVYTGLGVAAGLAGEGLAATLQTPWILGAFALLLVLLSLSMFGVYELRMPHPLTGRLAQASQRLQGGRLAGVFLMGGLSALIVSPCVAAPLAGALVYLSQTRDVVLGGSALFALAVGMSVPLLLLGLSAGALLPKAGPWMEGIKQFFGVLLLGVSVWTVQPLLPASLTLAAWGTLLALAAVLLRPFSR